MSNVVVIGGGFCGMVTAVNLVRLTDAPLRVTVLNVGHPPGRGVAYSTRRPEHVLNVVARNMSALADQPDHFLDWLGTRYEYADVPMAELREQFLPRRVYGDYLQSLFLWYSQAFADGKKVRIEWLRAEAVDVEPNGERVTVHTADGGMRNADKVVLATGNLPPADLPGITLDHPRYFRDPWGDWESRLSDKSEPIVLLGTGLTTVDSFLTLEAMGWQGKIFAVSRNGLLPMSHFRGPDYPGFPESDPTTLRLEEVRELLELHCQKLRQKGLNPAILVDKMRPYSQRLWQNFTVDEKKRFLAEFRARWGAARHRVPEAVFARVDRAEKAGRLEVVEGHVKSLAAEGSKLKLTVAGDSGQREILAGAVLNCTGPAEGGYVSPLYRSLQDRGMIQTDEVDLGIRATPDFAVVDKNGSRSKWLTVLGPPLRGSLWETTAVPELRAQAFRIAEGIIGELHALRTDVRPIERTYADVLEYSI